MFPNHFIEINYGQWMTQKTVFMIHSKFMYINKSNISITDYNSQKKKVDETFSALDTKKSTYKNVVLDLNKLTSSHFLHTNEDVSSNIRKIINCEKNKLFSVNAYVNTLSHISLKHKNKSFNVFEKVWLVNPNLRLGITLIEKKNRCVAISFSSDIRIH